MSLRDVGVFPVRNVLSESSRAICLFIRIELSLHQK